MKPRPCVILVTQKRASNYDVWNWFLDSESAEREINRVSNGEYWKNHGRKWKFRYRINIRWKDESHG